MKSIKNRIAKTILIAGLAVLFFPGCKKTEQPVKGHPDQSGTISAQILDKIKAAGFSTGKVTKVKEGYIVEGDILLTDDFLKSNEIKQQQTLHIGPRVNQYRSSGTLTLPNHSIVTYKILVSNLGANYAVATDDAITRYNDLNLGIRFERITSGTADITIAGYYDSNTDIEGFSSTPVNGAPYNSIQLNTFYYGTNPVNILFTATVIQHEIGHCVGMRHTDYADNSYSCGFNAYTESTTNVVLIPGTPSGPDAASWMLACNDGSSNRTFNANDIIALKYMFGYYPFGVYYKNSKTSPFVISLTNAANPSQTYTSVIFPQGSLIGEFIPSPMLPTGYYNIKLLSGPPLTPPVTYIFGVVSGTASTYPVTVNNVYLSINSGNYALAQITVK